MRNQAFDSVRGCLIISVIAGHIVLGSIHSQLLRYLIYAVHMPLFIALTGYLINVNKLREAGVKQTATYYCLRLLLPFLPAFIFFTAILMTHAAIEGRLSISLLLGYLSKPYYHLWFIPTLLLWVAALLVILKVRVPLLIVCLLFAPVSLAWAGLDMSFVPAVLLSKKVFFYAYFFFLGMVCRTYLNSWQHTVKRLRIPLIVLAVICAVFYIFYCGQPATPVSALAWFILNTLLVFLTLHWILVRSDAEQPKLLTLMGRHSLPIYLWHVLPMFLLKGLDVHQTQATLYYLVSIVFCIVLIFLVAKFEKRSSLLDRWVYGIA